ncbi:MAG TPA: glycosyl transferase family 39 [Dyella sp.]|uniref:glycosyl transferase family 39 n=1 Tax=Dyella sp. TaxID=1869338 RepID=UPI002C6FF301|nr:glycosyl transferase family 39 [Dyella sp.]HTV85258.1 glycosyl transferase family 39 [Dyella sp.]
MKHYLMLAVLLLAAVACDAVGLVNGSIGLYAAGALLELSFWFRLFKRRHQPI